MFANAQSKHSAFYSACVAFSNAHVIKELAARVGLNSQQQCNKLDVKKSKHHLYATEMMLLTKATRDPVTGEMDTRMIEALLKEIDLTVAPLPAEESNAPKKSMNDRLLTITAATGEICSHTLAMNATQRINQRTKDQVVKRAQQAVRELVMLMNEVEGKFQAVPVLSCAVDALGSMPMPGFS
ncbi:phage regulatory CII family protein [Photobacterium sp. CAU 1568]|uniref:Phage regulatory CII family protein n=1 Tax=Photobacterium arenosum TaxID=2774143 RepID=A0ABR9BRK0_9GAMM|nr:phage regulatory CII family protein [Photobacterium arenosum]MBD8515191.1 phage regulatory CII family protein [Photobacterium arenosum]